MAKMQFKVGLYGVSFYRTLEVENAALAERIIDAWLRDFFDVERCEKDEDCYECLEGDIFLQFHGVEPIAPDQLVERLKIEWGEDGLIACHSCKPLCGIFPLILSNPKGDLFFARRTVRTSTRWR